MTENEKNMAPEWVDPDDVPDLTALEWEAVIAKAKVQRGRPKAASTKVSTTIRLSPEVIEFFKKDGPGWQSRIDDALRKAAGV